MPLGCLSLSIPGEINPFEANQQYKALHKINCIWSRHRHFIAATKKGQEFTVSLRETLFKSTFL